MDMLRAARAGVTRFRAPLQVPDVRRMWYSDLLSVLGDQAAVLALAVLVYARSHSVLAVAVTSAAAFAPAFGVGPLLATLADRFAYRRVMIVCDLVRAGAYGVILIPGLPVPALVVIVFAAHCASFPFTAARGAQLPQIAGDRYGAAQALSQSTLQVGALLGFAVGGALLAIVGARGALALDSASFVVSALFVATVAARVRTPVDTGDTVAVTAWSRLRSGASSLRNDPLLFWPATLVTVAVLGATGAEALAVVVVHRVSHPHAGENGPLLALLLILPAVLTLITSVVCPTDGDPYRLVRIAGWMAIGAHVIAICSLLLLSRTAAGVAAALVAYACLGVSNALTVPCVSVVGGRLPTHNRASVFSLLEALLIGGQAVGALLAGVAVSVFGTGPGIAVLLAPAVVVSAVGISRLRTPQSVGYAGCTTTA